MNVKTFGTFEQLCLDVLINFYNLHPTGYSPELLIVVPNVEYAISMARELSYYMEVSDFEYNLDNQPYYIYINDNGMDVECAYSYINRGFHSATADMAFIESDVTDRILENINCENIYKFEICIFYGQ